MSKLARTLALMAALAGLSAGAAATAQDTKKKADDKKPAATKPADDKKAKAAAGTFEVYKDKGGKFRFRIKDGEGKQLGQAHIGYATKDEAEKVIAEIKKMAADAKIVDDKD